MFEFPFLNFTEINVNSQNALLYPNLSKKSGPNSNKNMIFCPKTAIIM